MKKQFETQHYTCHHGSVGDKHYGFRIILKDKQLTLLEFKFDNMNEDIIVFKLTVEKLEAQRNLHTFIHEAQLLHNALVTILYSLRGDFEYKKLIRKNAFFASIMAEIEQAQAHHGIADKNKHALGRARMAEPDAIFPYYQIPGQILARNCSEELYNHTPSNSQESTEVTQPERAASSSEEQADSQASSASAHPMRTRSRTNSIASRENQTVAAAAAAAPASGYKRKSVTEDHSNQADYPKSPTAADSADRASFSASTAALRSLSLHAQKKSNSKKEESIQDFKKSKPSSKKN